MDNFTRSSTCYQLSHITDLNNLGITAMRDGKNIDAILFFREAIKVVQSKLSSSSCGTVLINCKCISVINSIPMDDKHDYSMHDDVFILYNRALYLAPGIANFITRELTLYQITSPILLYNYALANQLEGLRTCDSWLMSVALDHYSRAYHTLKAYSHHIPENASSLSLGLLATANNVGHIHAYHCHHTKVYICCDEMMRLLATTKPPVNTNGCSLDVEYKLIFVNICFFLEADLAGAPAA